MSRSLLAKLRKAFQAEGTVQRQRAPWNVHKIESSSVRLENEGSGRKQGQKVGLGLSWKGPSLESVDLI